MQIKDTVAIVTGGASGLGEATVEGLVARGGRVAIFDVNEQAGEALRQKLGDRVLFCKVDVTSESSVTDAVKKTVDTFGALHICVFLGSHLKCTQNFSFLSVPNTADPVDP